MGTELGQLGQEAAEQSVEEWEWGPEIGGLIKSHCEPGALVETTRKMRLRRPPKSRTVVGPECHVKKHGLGFVRGVFMEVSQQENGGVILWQK